jgi:pimeloyl-ACP methyl ester carboxylesterase
VRAREPDETGFADRDGVPIYWERFGDGSPTLVLMPPWSIVHSRCWKGQVPYLARHFRVVVYDPRGNGRSGRPAEVAAYSEREYAADTIAVMDASGTDEAVLVGWSRGAQRGLLVATEHPERLLGFVVVCPALPLGPPTDRAAAMRAFLAPKVSDEGWGKWNIHHWRRDYEDFLEFFFGKVFPEPHSTKQVEDSIGWGLDTDPETLAATVQTGEFEDREETLELCSRVRCPMLVVHGEDDAIRSVEVGRELAAVTGAPFVGLPGCGHAPHVRKPVFFNALLRGFVEREARAPPLAAASTDSTKGDSQ